MHAFQLPKRPKTSSSLTSTSNDPARPLAPDSVHSVLGMSGHSLEPSTRRLARARFGRDFDDVRVHTDSQAADSADQVGARAYTVGHDIVFAAGSYSPGSAAGISLIHHELTHAAQQAPARSLAGDIQIASRHDPAEEEAERLDSLAGAVSPQEHSSRLARQVATSVDTLDPLIGFQARVRLAAHQRLLNNRQNLGVWWLFLQNQLQPEQLAAQTLATQAKAMLAAGRAEGGMAQATAEEWLGTQSAAVRGVKEVQVMERRYRGCTGCHELVRAYNEDIAGGIAGRGKTPSERLSEFINASRPNPSPGLGRPQANVRAAEATISQIGPYLQALGPAGYQVLPAESMSSAMSPVELRADIQRRISSRQRDYTELLHQIELGKIDAMDLKPIVDDLLVLEGPRVRDAVAAHHVQEERWQVVRSILIGAASILVLLLTIFLPPLGILAAAGLGGYLVGTGVETFNRGRAYQLGTGAHDVYSPAQQQSAGNIMAGGVLQVVNGIITIGQAAYGGVSLFAARTTAMSAGSSVLIESEWGAVSLRRTPDGLWVAVLEEEPGWVFISDGRTSAAYQVVDGRYVEIMSAPVRTGAGPAGTGGTGGATQPGALVPAPATTITTRAPSAAAVREALQKPDPSRVNWFTLISRRPLTTVGKTAPKLTPAEYATLTFEELRARAPANVDAAWALVHRVRGMTTAELREAAAAGEPYAKQVLEERPTRWTRTSAEPELATGLKEELAALRKSLPPDATGTLAVARTDLPIEQKSFEGGSPYTSLDKSGAGTPKEIVTPSSHGAAQNHAEEAVSNQLWEAVKKAAGDKKLDPNTVKGRVFIHVEQEVCSVCRQGLDSRAAKGVLAQISAKLPNVVFELTAGTADVYHGEVVRIVNGRRIF